jgi:hypothetical protein
MPLAYSNMPLAYSNMPVAYSNMPVAYSKYASNIHWHILICQWHIAISHFQLVQVVTKTLFSKRSEWCTSTASATWLSMKLILLLTAKSTKIRRVLCSYSILLLYTPIWIIEIKQYSTSYILSADGPELILLNFIINIWLINYSNQ